jgi:hypothetical protein
MLIVVKQLGVALRFFGSLLPPPGFSRLIAGNGFSPMRMS